MRKNNGEPQYEWITDKETILANPAFLRFARNFELYQNLLQTAADEKQKQEIIQKMHDLYTPDILNEDKKTLQHMRGVHAHKEMIEIALKECEGQKFSKEHLANELAESPNIKLFLMEWDYNPDTDTVLDKNGNVVEVFKPINEIVSYKCENNGAISVHIMPTGISSADFVPKLIEGFKEIARKLDAGELFANKIMMKSWLLSKALEPKAKLLLGDNIVIKGCTRLDVDMAHIQYMAMMYNDKSLEKYLTTGIKPEVRKTSMTREEFIARFKQM